MGNFLKPEISHKLAEALMETGISAERAINRAFVPEDDVDNHFAAHAAICEEHFDEIDDDPRSAAFVQWSLLCVAAINEEAGDRGMKQTDFPRAKPHMDALMAKIEAKNVSTMH